MLALAGGILLAVALPLMADRSHAPIPEAAMKAKTVYIVNETGVQKFTDRAYADIQNWGRFTVVQDKSAADLIIQFVGNPTSGVSMFVFAPHSEDAIFQDTSRPHYTWSAVVDSNIKAFRRWMDGN